MFVSIIVSFIFCFLLLILSVLNGLFVGYPLFIVLIIFGFLAVSKGYSVNNVIKMAYKGGKKSFIVLEIFILIGAITSAWMASGTVPAIVYYGTKFLNPNIFILSAFLISSLVSYLIGTSFGTIGTVGVALMVMARGGGVNASITAGAIISGAYFGDRCSPMSSSANLVAYITETELYQNVKNMLKTGILPFILSSILYLVFSLRFPLNAKVNSISLEIVKVFNINIITIIPALIILVFSFFKINVKKLMCFSIFAAALISITLQHASIMNVIKYLIFGYTLDNSSSLNTIIKGGGILSMFKISAVVFISSAFTGIFEETGMLSFIEKWTMRSNSKPKLFLTTIAISIATSAFGCSQALAVILTHNLMKNAYLKNKEDNKTLAVDIENTAIVIAPLIPWNIALFVPIVTLGVGYMSIVFCFYLYLIPIVNLIIKKVNNRGPFYETYI